MRTIRCIAANWRSPLISFALLLALCFSVCAEAPMAGFETANKLYEEGKFPDAASTYQKLIEAGRVSSALYFNLGNAFFKSGQTGRAIAAYRQAEQMTPRDPDVRANLQFARDQVSGPTLSPTRWQQWLGKLSLNEWTLLTAAALWMWLLLLALGQWRPNLKPALKGGVTSFGIAVVLLGACLATAYTQLGLAQTAVVVVPEAVAHYGPLPVSPTSFTLHDGAELRVLDQKDDWIEVSSGPQRSGWLRRDQVAVLK
jgi:tetratricopeptide (TPR) repeat protein